MNESEFSAFLQLGFYHIFNWQALDHLAFLVALAAPFTWRNWRSVILLATAFTVGHSVTLALSVLEVVNLKTTQIEILIPVTILVTSIFNVFRQAEPDNRVAGFLFHFLLAGSFGLIHGLGFSNYLKQLLGPGSRPVQELFSFNLGIELGQVLIVVLVLLLNRFAIRLVPQSFWTGIVSGLTALVSLYLLIQNV